MTVEVNLLMFLLSCILDCDAARIWGSMAMDGSMDCVHSDIHNDDMDESDYYVIKSDNMHGRAEWAKFPAECTIAFNFGDRVASVRFQTWVCGEDLDNPMLAVYQDCGGQRNSLLTTVNCSSEDPTDTVITSPTPCLTLYHYRGHTMFGYIFILHITAGRALISFPVGGIAAIFVLCMVGLMVGAKIFCVVSGFEQRLPNINLDFLDEQKHILENTGSGGDAVISVMQPGAQAAASPAGVSNSNIPPDKSSPIPAMSSAIQPLVVPVDAPVPAQHSVLRLSRSVGSTASGASSMLPGVDETMSELDLDTYLEVPVDMPPAQPRLKRYPSAKASSMFRHK